MNRLITTGIITIAILMNAPEAYSQKDVSTNQQATNTQEIAIKDSKTQPAREAKQISVNKPQSSFFGLGELPDQMVERDWLGLERFLIKVTPSQQ
jgi:hypothetical protein